MVVETVEFALAPGITQARVLELYAQSAARWAVNPDLVAKYYTYDAERQIGGGIYVWRSREAAARWHDTEYKSVVEATYGSRPTIRIVDAVLFVDPMRRTVERV